MRIPVVCTVLAFGLLACHQTTAYLNADDLTVASKDKDKPPAPACNDLQQQGNEVDLEGSRGAAPSAAGGAIADGTYVLTSSMLYTKSRPEGSKLVELGKITVVVNGATSQMVRNAADGRERRTTVTRVASGNAVTMKTTCTSPSSTDASDTSTTTYSASGSSFQFITPGPAGTVVATYTKVEDSASVAARH